jgi:hypothetical protein
LFHKENKLYTMLSRLVLVTNACFTGLKLFLCFFLFSSLYSETATTWTGAGAGAEVGSVLTVAIIS